LRAFKYLNFRELIISNRYKHDCIFGNKNYQLPLKKFVEQPTRLLFRILLVMQAETNFVLCSDRKYIDLFYEIKKTIYLI